MKTVLFPSADLNDIGKVLGSLFLDGFVLEHLVMRYLLTFQAEDARCHKEEDLEE